MLQLEFPYGQQDETKENVPFLEFPWRPHCFDDMEIIHVRKRPSRNYVEGDYYLYVEPVGSVVHHWLLISNQLYSRELNQICLTLASNLRSEDNARGVTMDEFPDAQSAVRWLNIVANEHGLGCETSHRGDEITLNGETCAVIHYVNVTIEDLDLASRSVNWHPRRFQG